MPGIVGITHFGAGILGQSAASPAFPLRVSPNSRYLVDQMGVPFRVHGEASWDAHINLSRADWLSYLSDRRARGINALHTYLFNSVAYYSGSSAPWLASLGGSGAGAAALPFLKNISGGTWNGDPTFSNHDADFSQPNDAYFAQVARFIDDAAVYGMAVVIAPMYLGFNLGALDGWWKTLTNANNTQSVCNTFGSYLASGHGTFTGFASRKNLIWYVGGDTLPTNGSEGALRALKVLQGLQSGGAVQLVGMHWQHDFLPNDQTDFSSLLTVYNAYTHGAYPPVGPTYAEARNIYGSQSPSRPTFLIETNYWGAQSATRANIRYFQWAASLSCIGGAVNGFDPFWGFATSADGTTNGSVTVTTAWIASTAFTLNQYVSHSSNWYRCTAAGTSASSGGPTGTGSSITDGSVTWAWVAAVSGTMAGMANLLGEPGAADMQIHGAFMAAIPWWQLRPESLGGAGTLITSGQGTFATWSDQNPSSGGMDWITSSVSADGSIFVAYVPHDHSGAFSVDMTTMQAKASAYWVDPVSGAATFIASIANTGTHSFTVPGANSGGDNDWVLRMSSP